MHVWLYTRFSNRESVKNTSSKGAPTYMYIRLIAFLAHPSIDPLEDEEESSE